jgi:hypothetical protein
MTLRAVIQEPPGRLPRIPTDPRFVSGLVRPIAERADYTNRAG